MIGASLFLLFQVVAGDSSQLEAAAEASEAAIAQPAAEAPAAKPKVVCRIEKTTGSRVRKQKVCKTESYDKASDDARRTFQDFQNKASMGGPIGIKQPGGG